MAPEEDFEHESLANFVEGLRIGKVQGRALGGCSNPLPPWANSGGVYPPEFLQYETLRQLWFKQYKSCLYLNSREKFGFKIEVLKSNEFLSFYCK